MLLARTIMLFVVAYIANIHTVFGTSLINRPIVLGAVTGLIMGDLQQGIIMGGMLELAFIGAVSIGAYIPPDMVSGTILGTAFAISAGTGPETALALGYPIATLMLAVNTVVRTPFTLACVHVCDAKAERGDVKGFELWYWITALLPKLTTVIIIPIAFYFGTGAVEGLLTSIPEWLQTGISLSGGLVPALGFAMLAQMIMNKKVAIFFFLGFFMVKYLAIDTTGVAIFATIITIVLVGIEHRLNSRDGDTKEVVIDEF